MRTACGAAETTLTTTSLRDTNLSVCTSTAHVFPLHCTQCSLGGHGGGGSGRRGVFVSVFDVGYAGQTPGKLKLASQLQQPTLQLTTTSQQPTLPLVPCGCINVHTCRPVVGTHTCYPVVVSTCTHVDTCTHLDLPWGICLSALDTPAVCATAPCPHSWQCPLSCSRSCVLLQTHTLSPTTVPLYSLNQ